MTTHSRKRLNTILADELKTPKRGSIHPCVICKTGRARFEGMKKGVGSWKWLEPCECSTMTSMERMKKYYV